ncbi:hypothetical protein [Campylobacter vicugnae]|uniref:hypothetical protein n=1 Tax=Campylobacter vicugnae TaxID=1660076 RepID=UPI000A3454D2|nr:hypothetical protein [Campylobacter sp. RM8835]
MNKLIIKYIGMFFLFLILVLGCMGFIIYDKLMIEYEKHIKEVIMWNIDNSEIKDQGTNIAQWDNIGNEIERIKRLSSPTEMFKELSQGVKSEDFLQSEIAAADLKPLIDAGTRQLKRAVEIQNIVFDSQSFSDKVYGLVYTDKYKDRIGEGDVEDIGLNLGYALQRNMSDKEFSVYMRKEYSKATKDDIRVATEFYKDVSLIFNQEMNSKYNDISLKNYDAIMKAYNDHKEYFGKDSKTFKSLINPKDVFDRLKGSNGKERLFISSLLATLPTEDLIGMLKDQGTEGFNAIMTLLDSRPDSRNSFNSAITDANKVLGNMGSNIGPDIIKAVNLYNSMGLENLVSINPNIANLSVNDRVYRNILDDDGNVIGREDTGLLRNNYNPMMFVELAKFLKGLEDKRILKNQGKNMINQGL